MKEFFKSIILPWIVFGILGWLCFFIVIISVCPEPLKHSIPDGEYTCISRELDNGYLTLVYEGNTGKRYVEKYHILIEEKYLSVVEGDEVTLPLEG